MDMLVLVVGPRSARLQKLGSLQSNMNEQSMLCSLVPKMQVQYEHGRTYSPPKSKRKEVREHRGDKDSAEIETTVMFSQPARRGTATAAQHHPDSQFYLQNQSGQSSNFQFWER
ncbi:hypothetical protein Ocin01_10265 [Orchesella cincta]|uniref:Uncharacterized protein n=1 Tax=Orchesella cincta TaxID=48709 RepID=A0A1D2MU45_ORCCI|nr:hypothetical protein Ocin01_10265 [Orchesella cincta]